MGIPAFATVFAVLDVFHNVADKYDLMNDAMSLGIHRLWKDYFVRTLDPSPQTKVLDVAGGTGDIAFRILQHKRSRGRPHDSMEKVVCCDINSSMLEVGRKRAEDVGVSQHVDWIEGDAQRLPFENDHFDAYTIAFGIRNVVRIEEVTSPSMSGQA